MVRLGRGLVLVAFGLGTLLRRKVPVADAPTAADRMLDALDGPEPPGWNTTGCAGDFPVTGFVVFNQYDQSVYRILLARHCPVP